MCGGAIECVCLVGYISALVSWCELSWVIETVIWKSAISVLVESVVLGSVSVCALMAWLVVGVVPAISLEDFVDLCLECLFLGVICWCFLPFLYFVYLARTLDLVGVFAIQVVGFFPLLFDVVEALFV